jgi:hypothetical protein
MNFLSIGTLKILPKFMRLSSFLLVVGCLSSCSQLSSSSSGSEAEESASSEAVLALESMGEDLRLALVEEGFSESQADQIASQAVADSVALLSGVTTTRVQKARSLLGARGYHPLATDGGSGATSSSPSPSDSPPVETSGTIETETTVEDVASVLDGATTSPGSLASVFFYFSGLALTESVGEDSILIVAFFVRVPQVVAESIYRSLPDSSDFSEISSLLAEAVGQMLPSIPAALRSDAIGGFGESIVILASGEVATASGDVDASALMSAVGSSIMNGMMYGTSRSGGTSVPSDADLELIETCYVSFMNRMMQTVSDIGGSSLLSDLVTDVATVGLSQAMAWNVPATFSTGLYTALTGAIQTPPDGVSPPTLSLSDLAQELSNSFAGRGIPETKITGFAVGIGFGSWPSPTVSPSPSPSPSGTDTPGPYPSPSGSATPIPSPSPSSSSGASSSLTFSGSASGSGLSGASSITVLLSKNDRNGFQDLGFNTSRFDCTASLTSVSASTLAFTASCPNAVSGDSFFASIDIKDASGAMTHLYRVPAELSANQITEGSSQMYGLSSVGGGTGSGTGGGTGGGTALSSIFQVTFTGAVSGNLMAVLHPTSMNPFGESTGRVNCQATAINVTTLLTKSMTVSCPGASAGSYYVAIDVMNSSNMMVQKYRPSSSGDLKTFSEGGTNSFTLMNAP